MFIYISDGVHISQNNGGNESVDATTIVNFGIDSPLSGAEEDDRPMWSWIVNNEEYLEEYHNVVIIGNMWYKRRISISAMQADKFCDIMNKYSRKHKRTLIPQGFLNEKPCGILTFGINQTHQNRIHII